MTHASISREIIVNEMVITDEDYVNFAKNSVRNIPINWTMQSMRNREGAGKGLKPNKSINIIRRRSSATRRERGVAWMGICQSMLE